MPHHAQRGGHAGLVLELGQRGAQGRFNILVVGAGAKVHEQLAHVGITLAHADIQLADAAVAFGLVATVHGVAQQLRLDLEEGQRLGDGVVQLARQHAALFGHRGFALQGCGAQAFHGAGQVARHGF
ncbi:hypothetical protein D9M69_688600 [compost metagenome]